MSRGGGAGRGGRGGFGPPGARLNHGTMPFDISPELMEQADKAKNENGLWPDMTVPTADPLSNIEMREVEAYLQLRAKFRMDHIIDHSHLAEASAKEESDKINFLLSMLSKHKELLPQELWGVCGLAKGSRYWPKLMNKRSTLSTTEKLAKYSDDEDENAKRPDADATEEDADNTDKDDDDKEKDEDAASQKDDDFEDDEDEMANDYNAEQYFDGGEDDGDDIGMDGGGWRRRMVK
ncbi:hypothetical protein MRB53_040071 [Persea americana]|nr:hypothetical protein MRB53_040071 [Persea americana]